MILCMKTLLSRESPKVDEARLLPSKNSELPRVTINMITAGMAAYRRWNPEEEELPLMVAAVFWAMWEASPYRLPPE